MSDERPGRLALLRERLRQEGLDALLVTSLANIRYLTGFSGSSALLVIGETEVLFLTDFRYQTQVVSEVGDLARVVIETSSLWSGLWRSLPQSGSLKVMGFESAHLLHRDFQRLLDAGADWQWRPTLELVEGLRARKDPGEVDLIKQAVRAAEHALGRLLPQLRPGLSEMEVAGMLESELRAAGSEGFPFPSIVASGPRSALPHARSSSRKVAPGEWLLLDFGAIVQGYCSDITRTFVIGRADARQREVYGVVREANQRAAAAVRAGMSGRDADGIARRYIGEHGFGAEFGHSLGHGIGLEVHEAPRLASTAEDLLPERAVVTIEPGIYVPEWGGVRIEDDVYLDGAESHILTTFTRELTELA